MGVFIELYLNFPQLVLLFHSKRKRRHVIILGFNAHMLITVYTEHPIAKILVPSGELQHCWGAITGHTTFPEMDSL